MELRATLETRHSEKKNSDYQVIVIHLTDTYDKIVFLDPAELELVKMNKRPEGKPSFLK